MRIIEGVVTAIVALCITTVLTIAAGVCVAFWIELVHVALSAVR